MKITKYFFFLVCSLFMSSCEEVINVKLDTAPEKLVIEATICWEKGTNGATQKIKLTKTSAYYNTTVPVGSGATISLKNTSNTIFEFREIQNTGEYLCTNFIPTLGETYTMTILFEGETYVATETLTTVTPITKFTQKNNSGFSGKDTEIKAYFNDPANQQNNYLFKYVLPNAITPFYYTNTDTFINGNESFSIIQKDNLVSGDKISVTHYGISQAYYNYMTILTEIAGNRNGSPFQTPPATIRGNIINTTNKANYPLGYFAPCETSTKEYTVE